MSDKKEEHSYTMLAKLLIVFLIIHLLAVITLILCFSSDHEVANDLVVPVSSVWCTGNSLKNRRCYFKNLCYSFQHDDFVFVRGKESVLQGIPKQQRKTASGHQRHSSRTGNGHHISTAGGKQREDRGGSQNIHLGGESGPLVDLSGGVVNHGNSEYFFSFVEIPDSAIKEKNFTSSILPEKMLVFKRFKPDNLMHVIHDDLLPLYATLNELEFAGARDYRIFFADNYGEGDYWDLYRVFRSKTFLNSYHPLLKESLRVEADKEADLVCFASASVGGVANTQFYQYGFDRYQGPVENAEITGTEVRAFASFIRKSLEIPKYDIDMPRFVAKVKQKFPYAVLFNRRFNRLIINEVELSVAISREFDLRIVTVNLETHSISEIVHLLEHATMLIGMHGAQLILSMFLPINAIVIEIFPFGIPAENYTPYRTLAAINGMGLLYRAWENKNELKSHVHPDYDRRFGGIAHLSEEKQKEITSNVPVKPHLCCQDPAFLYRMYQDTEVDVKSFMTVARDVYAEREERLNLTCPQSAVMITPAPVKHVNCSYLPKNNVFHVDWDVPWNVGLIKVGENVRYSVRVQPVAAGDVVEYQINDHHIEIPMTAKDGEGLHVWVAASLGQVSGSWSRKPDIVKL